MNKEVYLCPYDWVIDIEDDVIVIQAWCFDPQSNPVLLRINKFRDYLALELPSIVGGRRVKWNTEKIENLKNTLIYQLNNNESEHAPLKTISTKRKKLFYFGDDSYIFLYLYFDNPDAMKHCKNLLIKRNNGGKFYVKGVGECVFNIWEDDINVVRKLLTNNNLKYSDWMVANVIPVEKNNKLSTLSQEYQCNYSDIKPADEQITKSWRLYPKIIAIDYEVNSNNIYKFPNSKLADDVIFMVSLVYQVYSKPETRRTFIVLLGDCYDIPGVDIIKVKTETELLNVKDDIIKKFDPDIIIGHNTYGFDFPYEYTRRNIMNEDLPNTSRLILGENRIKSLDWNSDGAGFNKGSMIISHGRVYLDLLKIIKRNNNRLKNYDLNTCSNFYLGKSKHDITAQEMFLAYQEQRDLGFTDLSSDILNRMTKIVEYCANDSHLVMELSDHLKLWNDISEMSNAAGVPILEVYSQGMQRRSISRIYNEAYRQGVVLTRRKRIPQNYKGAHVLKPEPGIDDYVATFDFSGLYPNIIIAYNYCYRTLIPEDIKDKIDDDLVNIIRIYEGDTKYVYKYYKHKDRETILPKICDDLISSRKKAKMEMSKSEKEGDTAGVVIYNSKQNALKVTVNSVYGFLGVPTSEYSSFEIARSVTSKGRELILLVNRIISEVFKYRVVYNDTDSVMFVVNGCDNYEQACNKANEALKYINSILPQPLVMVLEKIGRMLRITRKKYIYWYWDMKTKQMERNKKGEVALHVTGVTTARRDNCKFQTDLYDKLSKQIMLDKPIQEAYDSILEVVISLMTRKYGVEDLYTVRELKSNYKSENTMMRLLAKRLVMAGIPREPGERLEFIIAKCGGKYVGENLRLVNEYKESLNTPTPYKIDYLAYIEKYLCKCIDQLFSIGYSKQLEKMNEQYLQNDVNRVFSGVWHNAVNYRTLITEILDKANTAADALTTFKGNQHLSVYTKKYTAYYLNNKNRIITRISSTPVANLMSYIKVKEKCLQELLNKK